jgi:hypothetical protein
LRLFTRTGDTLDLSTDAKGQALRQRSPGITCKPGELYLDGSELKIILSDGDIVVEADAVVGAYNFSCGTCDWATTVFSTSHSWDTGDTFLLISGTDSLLFPGPPPSTPVNALADGHFTGSRLPSVRIHKGRLVIDPGRGAQRLAGVTAYDAMGRMLGTLRLAPNTESVLLPWTPAARVVFLRLTCADGTTVVRAAPVVR